MGNSEHLAYVAGLVEGDGSITLSKGTSHGCLGFVLAMKIAMRSEKAIDRAAGVLGGKKVPDSQPGMWRLQLHASVCARACSRISHFLTSKREQAELAISFQNHVDANRRQGERDHAVSRSINDERLVMCERMRLLHAPSAEFETVDVGVSRTELIAYCAGLIDAEGSITVIKSGRGMLPAVLVQMTERAPLERLVRVFGGHVHEEVRRTKRGKTVYSWRLTSDNALEACKDMMSWLVAKQGQAEIVVRYQNNVNLWMRRLGFGNKNIPDHVRAQRAAMIEEVRALNSHRKVQPQRLSPSTPSGEAIVRPLQDGKLQERSGNDFALAYS